MFWTYVFDQKIQNKKTLLHSWNFFSNAMIRNIKIKNNLDIINVSSLYNIVNVLIEKI
jgi:hypothetical protein